MKMYLLNILNVVLSATDIMKANWLKIKNQDLVFLDTIPVSLELNKWLFYGEGWLLLKTILKCRSKATTLFAPTLHSFLINEYVFI